MKKIILYEKNQFELKDYNNKIKQVYLINILKNKINYIYKEYKDEIEEGKNLEVGT